MIVILQGERERYWSKRAEAFKGTPKAFDSEYTWPAYAIEEDKQLPRAPYFPVTGVDFNAKTTYLAGYDVPMQRMADYAEIMAAPVLKGQIENYVALLWQGGVGGKNGNEFALNALKNQGALETTLDTLEIPSDAQGSDGLRHYLERLKHLAVLKSTLDMLSNANFSR